MVAWRGESSDSPVRVTCNPTPQLPLTTFADAKMTTEWGGGVTRDVVGGARGGLVGACRGGERMIGENEVKRVGDKTIDSKRGGGEGTFASGVPHTPDEGEHHFGMSFVGVGE